VGQGRQGKPTLERPSWLIKPPWRNQGAPFLASRLALAAASLWGAPCSKGMGGLDGGMLLASLGARAGEWSGTRRLATLMLSGFGSRSAQGGVYDITDFVGMHPGGADRIMLAAGGAIDPFWAMYAQHNTANVKAILEGMRIGDLVRHAAPVPTHATSASLKIPSQPLGFREAFEVASWSRGRAAAILRLSPWQ
jgi:Cytochrome b5-like Heme/Steroid binding domain